MPYPANHRSEVKKKIVDSARRLFNRHGFEGVSVQQIMSGAGLTHGGFYSYFTSKSDLYTEVLACFFTDPNWKNHWEGIEIDPGAGDLGRQVVKAYLSPQHYDDVENSCPMVALPCDVTRSGKEAQAAFENVFEAMVRLLEKGSQAVENPSHRRAQAMAALCIGGMVVSRAMADRSRADELRDSCMAVALEMGGWNEVTC
jgi:TetR/AcrR family transcriptional regulator, transcriptional repressor for nem operon